MLGRVGLAYMSEEDLGGQGSEGKESLGLQAFCHPLQPNDHVDETTVSIPTGQTPLSPTLWELRG